MANSYGHTHIQHVSGSEWAQYCPRCGSPLENRYIEDEQHIRKTCSGCGFIFYLNPKVVVGAIPRQDSKIWLIRRNIEPALGRWTYPGGYLDLGETVSEAAIRETYEETRLKIRLDNLLNIYSYADSGIVLIAYRSTVIGGAAQPTFESQEVRAFHLEEIPWDNLAFPSTRDALREYVQSEELSTHLSGQA